jgi:hypothetical protein
MRQRQQSELRKLMRGFSSGKRASTSAELIVAVSLKDRVDRDEGKNWICVVLAKRSRSNFSVPHFLSSCRQKSGVHRLNLTDLTT